MSLRTPFERSAASIRGALVLRGEDADPHQVALGGVRIVRLPSGPARPVPFSPTVVDVAPHRDVFLPFEAAVADLEPGWYGLEAEMEVDGSRRLERGDRRFVVSWPRGSVHRARVAVARTVHAGGTHRVELERLDCEATTCTLHFRVSPPASAGVRLTGAEPLPVLDLEVDAGTGRGRAVTYPVPAASERLVVEVWAPASDRRAGGTIEVDLR